MLSPADIAIMHSFYSFHFLDTISHQLREKLEALPTTMLTAATLRTLASYQEENQARQGVYLLHYDERPVYVGKALDVAERLAQHLRKLSGRQNIELARVGYKALLLDKSMSTAANEDVLVSLFREAHADMWNGQGFGPKDPGQNRDTTRPGPFDTRHPIRADHPVTGITNTETVASLLGKMKVALPYVCRYNIEGRGDEPVNLDGVAHKARPLMQAVVNVLGPGWKAGILSYGMVLYHNDKHYPFGEEVVAQV